MLDYYIDNGESGKLDLIFRRTTPLKKKVISKEVNLSKESISFYLMIKKTIDYKTKQLQCYLKLRTNKIPLFSASATLFEQLDETSGLSF